VVHTPGGSLVFSHRDDATHRCSLAALARMMRFRAPAQRWGTGSGGIISRHKSLPPNGPIEDQENRIAVAESHHHCQVGAAEIRAWSSP